MRVLAAVGAVCALSASTTLAQSLEKGGKKASQPTKKVAPAVVKPKGQPANGATNVRAPKGVQTPGPSLRANAAPAKNAPAVAGRGASNDECTTPAVVSGSPVAFNFDNTVNTTGTSGQGNPACLFFTQTNINVDEWILWTANATGTASVSTCAATTSDTKVAVWDGAACPPTSILACNDDNCALQSSTSFPVVAGNQYLIQLGTYPGGATGSGVMTITGPGGGGGGPANNDCANAQAVGEGTFAFDTTGATQDATVACGFNANLDVWYSYTPSMTGTATWTTCTLTTLDTVLARFDACGGTQVQCLDDFCGLQTQISFPTVAGVPMLLRFAGYNNSQGTGSFGISVVGGGGGSPNDNCANATDIGDGTFNYDLNGATNDWAGSCGASGASPDTWYRYTASCDGVGTVSTCGLTTGDTVLTILDECGGPEILCLDDFCGLQTQVSFPTVTGEDYYIRIAGFNNSVHSGQFSVACSLPAANDNCADAVSITGAGPHNFDNSAATTDGNPDALCLAFGSDQVENDVWFVWGPAACGVDEQVEVAFCGLTGVDTKVAVYDNGTSPTPTCPTGAALACNDDSCGLQSKARFTPTNGNYYMIRVGTFPGAAGGLGQFTTNCVFVSPPVCTAYNPATDCQDTAFLIAYNITTFAAADSVTSATGSINTACVQGLYFNNAVVPDGWVITAYTNNGGVPGTVIDTFTQGVDVTVAGPAPTGAVFVGRDVQEWNFVFSRPIPAAAGTCVFIECRNNAAGDTVFQMDGDASNGNLQAAQDLNQDGIYSSPSEVIVDDLNICINGGFFNNALCFVDPCAGLTPANDDCSNAIALSVGIPATGTTNCANVDTVDSFCDPVGAPSAGGVWYSFVGTGNTMTVSLCNSPVQYDARMTVFCSTVAGCGSLVCAGADDDTCAAFGPSQITLCTTTAQTYYVLVHGFGAATGDFQIDLTDDSIPCGNPASCEPCTGITCPSGSIPEAEACGGDTNGGCNALPTAYEAVTCNQTICGTAFAAGGTRDTDWYAVTAPATGVISATLTADFSANVFVLDLGSPLPDPCGTITLVAQGSVFPCQSTTVIATGLIAGNSYVVFVSPAAFDGVPCDGHYALTIDQGISCVPCCDFNNDNFINSQDFFDFLVAFFAGNADFNGDGLNNSQDFFDFLVCFFAPPAGCP